MRVWISNYRDHWISPYTMIDWMFFWTSWSRCHRTKGIWPEDRQWVERPDWCDRWADRLEPLSLAIKRVLSMIYPRVTHVKIHHWDTWSMDNTLAMIVLPMLQQLQATKHGAPHVDDEDVPEHLRSTAAAPKENPWDVDSLHFDRWDWVLGEMIFAFHSKVDESWQEQFHSGEHDFKWVPVDAEGNEVPKGQHQSYRMDRGPNDTHVFDDVGYHAYEDRIQNGFRLFGKYYGALWS